MELNKEYLNVPRFLSIQVYTKSLSRRCKTKVGSIYGNGGKAWVVGSFHSSFKEELFNEFLDEHDLQNFAENLKTKIIKDNARNKDNASS